MPVVASMPSAAMATPYTPAKWKRGNNRDGENDNGQGRTLHANRGTVGNRNGRVQSDSVPRDS